MPHHHKRGFVLEVETCTLMYYEQFEFYEQIRCARIFMEAAKMWQCGAPPLYFLQPVDKDRDVRI